MPIKELRSFFEKQGIESKLVEINKLILNSDFWENKSNSEKILKEKKMYDELVNSYKNSFQKCNEIIEFYGALHFTKESQTTIITSSSVKKIENKWILAKIIDLIRLKN